jgi:uncharacterized protein
MPATAVAVASPRRAAPVDQGWFSTVDASDHWTGAHPARWGVGDALLGLLFAQLATFGAVFLLIAVSGRDTFDDLSIGLLVVLQAFLWVGYGGWTLFVASRKGNGLVRDLGWRFRGADVHQGLLLGVGLQLLAVPAIFLVLQLMLGELDVSGPAQELTDLATTPLDVVLLVLVVAVGAPVVEELFFRGLLLRALERRWGSKAAIAVSSLVFAVVHFQVVQFPALLMFGLVAGWLTVRSGRLGPAIWAHVGFNAVTVVVLLVVSS